MRKPTHPALPMTTRKSPVAGSRSGHSGFTNHSIGPTGPPGRWLWLRPLQETWLWLSPNAATSPKGSRQFAEEFLASIQQLADGDSHFHGDETI